MGWKCVLNAARLLVYSVWPLKNMEHNFLGGDLSDKMQIIQTHDRLPSHTLHTHLHLKLIRAYI